MSASTHGRLYVSDAQYVSALLIEQQHLFPHRTIRATIRHVASQCGLSEKVAEDTVQAIFAEGQRPAGRLRRAEILDFASRLATAATLSSTASLRVPSHQDARAA